MSDSYCVILNNDAICVFSLSLLWSSPCYGMLCFVVTVLCELKFIVGHLVNKRAHGIVLIVATRYSR